MLESVLVYGLLTTIMVVCGTIAASREPLYEGSSGLYVKNNYFLQPEIFVIIAAFTFVFGCRYGVGVDYFHYLYAYENRADFRFEFLFKTISDILRNMGFGYPVFFSVWAFLQITLLYYAFKNYRFIFPYIALFLIFSSTMLSLMNIIRQQLAACVFLVSLQFIEKKQPLYYYLCVLVAYWFHRSALILIVIYPLFRFRSDWFSRIWIQIVLYLIAVYLHNRFDLVATYIEAPFRWFSETFGFERYGFSVLEIESLDDRGQFGRNTGMGIYVSLFKTIPIILLSKDLKSYYNSRFFNMIYTGWFISVLSGLAFGSSITLSRPFVFFMLFQPVLWSFFIYYCFRKQKPLLSIYAIGFLLLQIALFVNIISFGEINTSAYTFFWQH